MLWRKKDTVNTTINSIGILSNSTAAASTSTAGAPSSAASSAGVSSAYYYCGEQNVILSVCGQNIYRLWVESSNEERFQFSVCCLIQPDINTNWQLSPAVDWLN